MSWIFPPRTARPISTLTCSTPSWMIYLSQWQVIQEAGALRIPLVGTRPAIDTAYVQRLIEVALRSVGATQVGVRVVAVRPPLPPEDVRFTGATVGQLRGAVPGLTGWLRPVLWVLGGYIATTGLRVVHVANSGLRTGSSGAVVVPAVAGATSAGWMFAMNFMIDSDFTWALLALDGLWLLGLLLAVGAR